MKIFTGAGTHTNWFSNTLAAVGVIANTTSSTFTPDPYDESSVIAFMSKNEDGVRCAEASLIFLYNMKNAKSKKCIFFASCTLYSALTGLSVSGTLLRFLKAAAVNLNKHIPFFQSSSDWIDVCDNLYSNLNRVKKSVLANKIIAVFNNVVAHAAYARMGIEVDPKLFKRFEEKKMRPTIWEFATFADAAVGMLLFVVKAGRHAMLTGSIEAFFVDSTVVTKWLDAAAEARKNAEFINAPQTIGLTLAGYISQLDEQIKKGEELVKIFKSGQQHTIIFSVLLELRQVRKRYEVSIAASKFRRAPIGVFIYGQAGVAKSTIALGLFNHYCSIRGIEAENATMWTRDDNDPFYSGYRSHFAGVLYDDAAKFVASKVQGVDPSIKDIISAINNIPFVTNQGELADKGKIPFLSEWVGVSSNLGDLNADRYYNCSAAFIRRLPVRIEPIVKPEYRLPGETRIDASKIPANVQYPNLWEFKVCVPHIEQMKATYVEKHHFTNYSDLLLYMTGVYEDHIATQDKLMETISHIGPEELCQCKVPKSVCVCDTFVVDETVLDNVQTLFGGQSYHQASTIDDSDDGTSRDDTPLSLVEPDVAKTRALREWMTKFVLLRRDLQDLWCKSPSHTAYFKQIWDSPIVAEKFAVTYVRSSKDLEEIRGKVEAEMCNFDNASPRDRLDMITGDIFSTRLQEDGEDYLDFEPRKGKPCHFLQSQLAGLKEQIMEYVLLPISESEQALLDDFLYHKAPLYVSEGWPMKDITRAAMCYLEYYAPKVDTRFAGAEVLEACDRKRSWSIGLWFATQYFEHPKFAKVCDTIARLPPVQWAVRGYARRALRHASSTHIIREAQRHDDRLGARNPFVLAVVGMCASALFVLMIAKIWKSFTSDDEDDEIFFDMGPNPAPECDTEGVVVQADLSAVGHVPVVREEEKKNVWTVEERNISKLDVHPRRPQDFEQCLRAVKSNLVYMERKVLVDGRPARKISRGLVISKNKLLMNHHFIKDPGTITVWIGPRTKEGVQPSFDIDVTEDMLEIEPERDFAIVHTDALPAQFRNIAHLFPNRTFQSVGKAFYVMKKESGDVEVVDCVGLHVVHMNCLDEARSVYTKCWAVRPKRPTEYGECGSVLVVQTPIGCVIVGFHTAYNAFRNLAYSMPLYSDDADPTPFPTVGYVQPVGTVAQVLTTFVDLLPTDKLFSDFHKDGRLMVHGQLKGFRPRSKFTGRKTVIAEQVLTKGQALQPPIQDNMAAPIAHPWKQAQMVLENYLNPTHGMSEVVLRACTDAFVAHINANLTEEDWSDIHPVPVEVAVNGYPGVPNVDAQKFTTSGGHGFRGPKLQYLSEPEKNGPWEHFRRYDDVVLERVEKIVDDARIGVRPHAIYTACMKDEMLSKAKVEAGKARVIYMCPVDFLTAMRMFTLGLTRVMVRRRDLFGIAVGLNTHSEEWDDLVKQSQRIPGDLWEAGDFGAFESVLGLLLSNNVNKVFVELARRSGNYNEEDLLALETLLADTVNPTIDFFGMLITLLGGEASGHQVTTFFNCTANLLLHMYAYVVTGTQSRDYEECLAKASEYFDNVFHRMLGDDVFQKISPNADHYNHTTIQKAFADIGIRYTMADKLAESVPYIPLEEVTFLKRSFVDHEDFPGMKVAALDKKSIYKMLLYTIPSKSTTPEQQLASAIASAQAEAYFHGHAFFNQISHLIDSLEVSEELAFRMHEMPRPSMATMYKRFVEASPKLRAQLTVPGETAETAETRDSYCQPQSIVLQAGWRMDSWGSTTMECSSEERIHVGVRLSPTHARKPKKYENALRVENQLLATTSKNTKICSGYKDATLPTVQSVVNKLHNKSRANAKRKAWQERVVLQSSLVLDNAIAPVGAGSEDLVQETTVFKNEPESISLDMRAPITRLAGPSTMPQDLGNYLSRPALIHTYTWTENTANGVKTTIQPWALFLGGTTVLKKLQGFSLIRANLKLKFLINGSPFYYGSMMAVYSPLQGYTFNKANGNSLSCRLVAMSQKPHVWLENQNMSSAEMTLPFLYPYPMLDLSLQQKLIDMGTLELVQFVPLLSANGSSSTNVDIQVYAWAEDVELSGPTDQAIAQSGYRHDGQISGPASAVAKAAGSLKQIPILGPYAMATEMAANTLGNIASMFGFTNVPNVSDVQPMKQMPFQLASTQISEPVHKLSLQPKQETAIGSVQHGGLKEDELVITRFAGRSSFLVGSLWDTTNTPGTALFTTAVTPHLSQVVASEIAHTPMSFLANHFQYWRGSLRFTFKVIRSPYHRGRLQVAWDRAATNLNAGPTVGNMNTFTTIIDLDEDSECSFVVPYMQEKQFLPCPDATLTPTVLWSTDIAPSQAVADVNGVLSLRVVNRLTAPEASSSATILVFVNAEPDIEFAAPRDFPAFSNTQVASFSSLTNTSLQSKVLYDDAGEAHDFVTQTDADVIYKEMFGERVTSMRELMHRSSVSFVSRPVQNTSTIGIAKNSYPLKRMPPPPGFYNNGWWAADNASGAAKRVFYSRMHPLLTMSNCFVGYKGSVNVTVNVEQPLGTTDVDSITISRVTNGETLSSASRLPAWTVTNVASDPVGKADRDSLLRIFSGASGTALTNTKTNAGFSAQLPYYSPAGFQISNLYSEYNNGTTFTPNNRDWWVLDWRYNKAGNATTDSGALMTVYYSSGPDFDCVFFMNVPIISVYNYTAI